MSLVNSAILEDYKHRSKELIDISAPLIAEQIFITLMGIVNTMMASSIGEYAVSAVGMIDSISHLIVALFAAMTTGGTIVVAQYIGRKEKEKATGAAAQAIVLATIFSVVIALFFAIFRGPVIQSLYGNADADVIQAANTYLLIINFSFPILALTQTIFGILRGSGDTRTPMFITIAMNVFNVIFGYILIFGIRINLGFFSIQTSSLGITGAALALLLARLIGLILCIYYIAFGSKNIRLNGWQYFKPDFKVQKVVLGLGVPTSIESGLFNVGKLLTQIFIVGMGTAAIAANSVAGSIMSFMNVPGQAFSTGVMILVGQRVGKNEIEDVKKTIMFAVKLGMVMLGGLCLICFPLTNAILSLYKPGPESMVYIKQILYAGYVATPLLWSISFIPPAGLRATGDVKYTMVVAVISMWTFRIVFGYLFGVTLGLGVVGVWFGMYIDWIVRGLFFYLRLANGKWKGKSVKA